jgi:protein disulfide-isomerase
MKHLLIVVLVALSLNGFAQQKPLEWHTDVSKAINVSVENGKPLLFFFTGSDWCGWCKRLQKEVFFKPEFSIWANKNVVVGELDFPRKTKLSAELQKQNRELGQMFGVRGYPTIWFVTPIIKGNQVDLVEKRLGSQGYVAGGAKAWIAGADKIIKTKK